MSNGFFSDIGLDTNSEEMNKTQKVVSGGILAPGVYKMQIDKVYAVKKDSGAVQLNVEFKYPKEDGEEGKFFWNSYVQSGDEKGNKATYTDKNTGKEKPLPGVLEFRQLCQAAGIDNPKTVDATIELFGEPTPVKAIPEMTGKVVTVGIRNMYDDYREQDVAFVELFLDRDGKNSKGEDLLDKLKEKIEKTPYKKSKKKKEAPKAEAPVENTESPW